MNLIYQPFGTAAVEAYVKNFAASLGDGIASLSFWLDECGQLLTPGKLPNTRGGRLLCAPTENGVNGDVLSSVAFGSAWNSRRAVLFVQCLRTKRFERRRQFG